MVTLTVSTAAASSIGLGSVGREEAGSEEDWAEDSSWLDEISFKNNSTPKIIKFMG